MTLRSALHHCAWLMLAAMWALPAAAQEEAVAWRIELTAPDDVRALLEEHLDVYRYRGRSGVDAAML